MKLEELARQSSHDARVSVAHLDLPPIGEERRNRSWTTPVLAAAGVAAVVVTGLVVVNQLNRGDEAVSDDDVLPPVVEVPRLGLPPDSGWSVTMATTGDEFASPRGSDRPTFTYYGTSGADDPFADGDLLIASFGASEGAEIGVAGETLELRGTTATLSDGLDAGLPAGSLSIEWIEQGPAGSLHVIMVSQQLDRDRLLSVAAAAEVDVERATVTPAADLGLDRLASASGTPFDAFRTSSDGYLIGYERASSTEFLVLSTSRGDIDREVVVLRWWMPDVTATTVDGRPGYVSSVPEGLPGTGRPLIWAPADGIVANLTYFGANGSFDPVAVAETVVELDDATWDALVGDFGTIDAGASEFDEVFREVAGQTDGAEYRWVLGLQGDELCFNFSEGLGGYGSCQARSDIVPPAGTAIAIDSSSGDRLATVLIAADPAVDDVVSSDEGVTIDRIDADGLSWFVAISDASARPSFDVIVDGAVVDTIDGEVLGVAEAVGEPGMLDPAIAEELGLEDLEVVLAAELASESWYLGLTDDQQCLVVDVDGRSDAVCQPLADIVVFGPFEVPDGDRSFVSAIVPAECGDRVWIEGVDLPYGATAGGGHMVFTVAGSTAGANLTIERDGDRPATVALPSPSGTASYPADPCGA